MKSARARRAFVGVVAAIASAAVIGGIFTSATATPADVATHATHGNGDSAIVVFDGEPLLTHPRTSRLRPPLDLDAAPVRAVKKGLAVQHDRFRGWLRASSATVTREYHLALNAVAVELNGAKIADLRGAPGVRGVHRTQSYEPLDTADPDLTLINAISAWRSKQVGGAASAGADIDVGVIDSGIDVEHPCFDDTDYPVSVQRGDLRFTNNKVVVARVFHSDSSLTPEAVGAHGTHVAGTVACNADTPASVRGADVPYRVSGVAPAARLGNYNVFPGDVGTASDEDLLDALEAAYRDGMDVINLSLGGPAARTQDPIADAVDNLDESGVVVTVAAGNDGPGEGTVASPGTAKRALTSGASTVGHFVGTAITTDGRTFRAAAGDFPTVRRDLTAPLGVVEGDVNGLGTACEPLDGLDLTGRIAVVSRGDCSFSAKVRTVEDAGARGALVVNDVAGDPTSMAADPSVEPKPTIPAYMVGRGAARGVLAANGASATIDAEASYFRTGNENIMAGFSGQGPTPDTASLVKPDVVAPGANVLASVPADDCDADTCWAFMEGTSMAAPHLAGMAAVLRAAHPEWTSAQVRSAVVNTAAEGALTQHEDGRTVADDVTLTGAGLADLRAAVGARVALGPVSTSFRTLTGRSPAEATVRLTSLTGKEQRLSVSIDSRVGEGVRFTAPGAVTVPARGTATITLRAVATGGKPDPGPRSAILRLTDSTGTDIAHSVLFAMRR
ncbi:S8 family serine peptidase [Haloechinothrix halophila]|uniref:S8 family serine peptidase n=1 Tax=Haloechinothrix halophila TaxID=1069073 RepID=UPI00146FA739|nr:S8 family serine peptidase [Haloechinothrix halophila]